MNTSTLSSLLFIFSLIFVSYAPSPASGIELSYAPSPASGIELYKIVCKDAEKDNDRCLKLLEPYPQITSAKDYVELCRFVLEMAINKSTEAQNYLKEVMKTNPAPMIEYCATSCYDGLVSSFQSSIGELIEDPTTANYDAKVAGDGPVTCDAALADAKIVNASLTTLNNNMQFLSYIAYLATNYLPDHY